MAKTAAERAKKYRLHKAEAMQAEQRHESVTAVNEPVTAEIRDESVTETKCDAPSLMGAVPGDPIGPLDIYSEQRWSYLQSMGHVWDADRQRSTRPAKSNECAVDGEIIGVTVPGDPAYTAPAMTAL